MQLTILGMHRSGTSVLARIMNLMGAYFGPEGSSTGANEENPKGFWERRDVRIINDTALYAMGCDWNRVDRFDIQKIPDAAAAEFHKDASRLILGMDAHRPWFLKEPRLCLLFPLWKKELESPVCIHIFRHPVEVASSLQKRNGIPILAGLALWEFYVKHALVASAGLPQVTVSHRRLIENPYDETKSLFEALEAMNIRGLRLPSVSEVNAFIEPKLYRERENRSDLRSFGSEPQVSMFNQLLEKGPSPALRRRQISARSARALSRYEATLTPLPIARSHPKQKEVEVLLREQIAAKEKEIRRLDETVQKLLKDLEIRRDQILARDEKNHRIEEILQKARSDLEIRREQISERNDKNEQLEDALRKCRSDLEIQRKQIAERDDKNKLLQQTLDSVSMKLEEYRLTSSQEITLRDSALNRLEASLTLRFRQIATLSRLLSEMGLRAHEPTIRS